MGRIKSLQAWRRVAVPAGKTVSVPFTVDADMLALQGAAGHGKRLHAGEHSIGFSRGHGAASLHSLAVRGC